MIDAFEALSFALHAAGQAMKNASKRANERKRGKRDYEHKLLRIAALSGRTIRDVVIEVDYILERKPPGLSTLEDVLSDMLSYYED